MSITPNEREVVDLEIDLFDAYTKIDYLENVLKRIVASVTPNSNATVKRMVAIAKEGLENAED